VLYIALVVSAILLLAVNLIAWTAKHPVMPILGTAFLFLLLSFFAGMGIFLPPAALQAALLCVVALIWGASHYRPRFFLTLSCVATLIAFGVPGFFAIQETRHLQEAFPYISMDDRLAPPKVTHPSGTLHPAAIDRLAALESRIEEKDRDWLSSYRTSFLREIHENTVQVFVSRPGFGIARMISMSEEGLKRRHHGDAPIPQPGTPSASPWLPELLQKEPVGEKTPADMLSLHRDSVVDFVNVAGFGYVKDRQHFAGFQEHQVSQTPTLARPWKLQTLDLVGLLLHDEPIAYVSENLPRMEELRAAPIRDLDDFETAGLLALQRGEDLFVRERGQERRMLGAIRAVRQCLTCHEVQRGDLLGAFSYRMTEDRK
jgi:hypothetical protein